METSGQIEIRKESRAHNNSLASGEGLMLVENFVILIRLLQWEGAQV